MIRVFQKTTSANEHGVRYPGEHSLPEAEAAQLVADGYAVYLDQPAKLDQEQADEQPKRTAVKKVNATKAVKK